MVIQGLQGATTALFGRSEGINEHGLAVSQSSCGFPVSNLPQMRNPGIKGLQFWAVIRSLLENCKTVDEALSMLTGMPIAYNINLYLADAAGEIALYETMNGEAACERIGAGNKAMACVRIGSEEKNLKKDDSLAGCLFETNHIAIKSFQNREPLI
ncbi:MAG: carcinine hydrolase/isopenicillin-N N-acyltransferase family protein [bacterium]|nr:carcinine hydrolase/isopenicillin-N N-acyltransferase family protein [bacterium]